MRSVVQLEPGHVVVVEVGLGEAEVTRHDVAAERSSLTARYNTHTHAGPDLV